MTSDPMMRWRPGERERWLGLGSGPVVSFERTPARFLATAPDHVARPLLAGWFPPTYHHGNDLKVIVARFEMDAHPAIVRAIGISRFAESIEAATPYATAEIAQRMADVVRLTLPGAEYFLALAWLRRNAALAARTVENDVALRRLAATGVAERDAVLAAGHILAEAEPVDLPAWADDRALCTVLAHTDRWGPHPALHAHTAGRTLADYGWQLFRRWRGAGWPSEQRWALHALGALGDDDTARRLAPLLPRWYDRGRQWRWHSQFGVDVLARIGTDAALVELLRLAEDRSRSSLAYRAERHLHVAAVSRGLADHELTDPLVVEAELEVVRLERAMARGRRWTGAQLRELILAHPARSEPARGLVWGVYSGDVVLSTFRIAGSFVDASDRPVRLADDAIVGIVHPLDGADLAPWAGWFDNQPFPQLARLTRGAPADLTPASLAGTVVSAGAVPALLRRGWQFHGGTGLALQCDLKLRLTDDRYAVVTIRRKQPPDRATILGAEVRGESPLGARPWFELMYDLWQAVNAT